jgi:hypothetical protein
VPETDEVMLWVVTEEEVAGGDVGGGGEHRGDVLRRNARRELQ